MKSTTKRNFFGTLDDRVASHRNSRRNCGLPAKVAGGQRVPGLIPKGTVKTLYYLVTTLGEGSSGETADGVSPT